MANNVYVNAGGQKYLAAAPANVADQMLPFVDADLAGVLTAQPQNPTTVHTAYVAAKVANGNMAKKIVGWFLPVLLLLLLAAAPVEAQTLWAVTSQQPNPSATANGSFQSLQTANGNRRGCFIQNNSATNVMYVYFGPIANALTTNSLILQPNWAVNCENYPNVLVDQVSIQGTTSDKYYANFY